MHGPFEVVIVLVGVALRLVYDIKDDLIVFLDLLALSVFFFDFLLAVLDVLLDLLLEGQQLAEAVPLVVDDRLEDELFLAIVFVVLQAAQWFIGKRAHSSPVVPEDVVESPERIALGDHKIDMEFVESFLQLIVHLLVSISHSLLEEAVVVLDEVLGHVDADEIGLQLVFLEEDVAL